ncbi:MAG: DUF2721 domain-containing protein [Rhodoferax sp.]|nr:DUF2721 domain-containing protein [Rhodoferax sp.]
MPIPLDSETIVNGIRLSVAPVFLLTAVSGLIGAVAQRLARIIDRARHVERAIKSLAAEHPEAVDGYRELGELRSRGLLANGCIALLTACGFLIGLTIVALFLGETIELPVLRMSIFSFVGGVICFLLALVCFMAETFIATRLLNFGRKRR